MKFLITLIISLSFSYANNQNPFKEVDSKKLRPHIIDHPNPGCPTNAECSPASGIALTKFKKLLARSDFRAIKKMQMNEGIPIDIWSQVDLSKVGSNYPLITWDSPCQNHQLSKPLPIHISLAFVRNINDIKKDRTLLLRKIYIDRKENQYVDGLREGSPLYFSKEGIHYIRDFDGLYYDLIIKNNGDIKISKSYSPKHYPQTIECTKELLDNSKEILNVKDLYNGLYCQKIWNIDMKKYTIIVQGNACL